MTSSTDPSSDLRGICIPVTGISPSVSKVQREQSARIANKHGFLFEMVETNELDNNDYRKNPANRCYFCKTELYGLLSKIAKTRAIDFVVDGANFDDLSDHRPGNRAASEHRVSSPLATLRFSKKDIRFLSERMGLETWDKPASPCLASRIQIMACNRHACR